MGSRRITSPAPPSIGTSSENSHRRQDSSSSDDSYSEKEKVSGNPAFPLLPPEEDRKASGNSPPRSRKCASSGSYGSSGSYSASKPPHSPTVNNYTYCGRHSDQYLFNGWSNIVKSPFKKS
ncbi:hypothetical protein F5Y05DRAFT_25434 [Hypoxylon sp. FL0543]|nr:hypothetical protein F5Y05DRAFT_25434 [Hypoxylon sp. FL0543]